MNWRHLAEALFLAYIVLILGVTTLFGLLQLAANQSPTPVTDVVFLIALIGAILLAVDRLVRNLTVKALDR